MLRSFVSHLISFFTNKTKRRLYLIAGWGIFLILQGHSTELSAWHDKTHLAVAKAAGYERWYNAAGADMAKIKAGDKERFNHWFDNTDKKPITPKMVKGQMKYYDDPSDKEGHLYGAILASLKAYEKSLDEKKYAEYHLAFCAHYIGDLSQPLHNSVFDNFNKKRHSLNDGLVEEEVMDNIEVIRKLMKNISFNRKNFQSELAAEIARIAGLSSNLAEILRKENRNMTKDEVYRQLAESASLFKAILNYYKNQGK